MSESYPPCGYSRADGLDGRPGTPTPNGTLQFQPSPEFLEEFPESPQIEQGEHYTFVHRFKSDQNNAAAIVIGTPRGTPLVDSFDFQYKVLTSQYDQLRGDVAQVTITAECINIPPEDEFHVETVEFNPSIFLHPKYATIVSYSAQNASSTQLITGPIIIGWINNAVGLPSQIAQGENANQLNSDNITDADVLSLALELVQKLQRGEETYYLSGWRVYWTQYSTFPGVPAVDPNGQPTGLNPGGYIEDPVAAGGLPAYFWSLDGTPTGDNTFTITAQQVNPTMYPPATDLTPTISWLRQADTVEYQRVWFKIVHSWIGAPGGTWDVDLYPLAEGSTT